MGVGTFARQRLVQAITDLITDMAEPKWDDMASVFFIDKLEEAGWDFKENHALGNQGSKPGPEASTPKVSLHGGN